MIFLHFFFLVIVHFHIVLFSFCFGSGSVFLAMLVVKAILVICFLCVGLSQNWLNANKSQNCEKFYRSIQFIFQLPVLVHKYCYLAIQNGFLHN